MDIFLEVVADIISATSVTYLWTTDEGAGLGVDEVTVIRHSFLP